MQYCYFNYNGYDSWKFKFNAGEGLELHEHSLPNYHDTIVLSGKCEISGPDKNWTMILEANDRYNFTDDEMHHEIVALENDTEILNVYRHPMPQMKRFENKGWLTE